MRILRTSFYSIAVGAASVCCSGAWATGHHGKRVGYLQPAEITTDCFYFTLEGVTQADPAKPNDPWFAVLRTQSGAKEMYATLLAAKLSGSTLTQVNASGTIVCGYPQATMVML